MESTVLDEEITITGNIWSVDTPNGPPVRLSLLWDEDDALSVAVTVDGAPPVELHLADGECAPLATLLRRLPRALQGVRMIAAAMLL